MMCDCQSQASVVAGVVDIVSVVVGDVNEKEKKS